MKNMKTITPAQALELFADALARYELHKDNKQCEDNFTLSINSGIKTFTINNTTFILKGKINDKNNTKDPP